MQNNRVRKRAIVNFILLLLIIMLFSLLFIYLSIFGIEVRGNGISLGLNSGDIVVKESDIIKYICCCGEEKCEKLEEHDIGLETTKANNGLCSGIGVSNSKIKPYIVKGIILEDTNSFSIGDIVEIVEDIKNGREYLVREYDNTLREEWITGTKISILGTGLEKPLPISDKDKEHYVNNNKFISDTPYLIWTDLHRQETNVFIGGEGKCTLDKKIKSTGGSDKTPTKRGIFKIEDRGEAFKEPNSDQDITYYNWVRYSGSYLYHSLPKENGKTKNLDALGKTGTTSGCIGNNFGDAQWIYDIIPTGTTVVVN